jgi:RNA polymerase-binding protein DksA
MAKTTSPRARKSTARKSTARKSTARKTTARKTAGTGSKLLKQAATGAGGKRKVAASKAKAGSAGRARSTGGRASAGAKSAARRRAGARRASAGTASAKAMPARPARPARKAGANRKAAAKKKKGVAKKPAAKKPAARKPAAKQVATSKASSKRRAGAATQKTPNTIARASAPAGSKGGTARRGAGEAAREAAGKRASRKEPKRPTRSPYTRTQLNPLRKALHVLRTRMMGDISLMEQEALRANDPDIDAENVADHGSDAFERNMTLGLMEGESRTLRQIYTALETMQAGRYGLCAECGAAIPFARLEALPFAQNCVPCQEEQERGF